MVRGTCISLWRGLSQVDSQTHDERRTVHLVVYRARETTTNISGTTRLGPGTQCPLVRSFVISIGKAKDEALPDGSVYCYIAILQKQQ